MKPKLIPTREIMWDLFQAYTKETKSKPFLIKDWVGSIGKPVEREKEKPLTMVGFECYVFKQGLNAGLSHYFANAEEKYGDFIEVCSMITKCIRADQIEGGMAQIYSSGITARLNNLVDKVETTVIEVVAEFGTKPSE